MSSFQIHISNRMELLLHRLAAVLQSDAPAPMIPEIIIVQSRGMARWITIQLAERLGIAANLRFPFPNAFFGEMATKVLGHNPRASGFEPELLTWTIISLLGSLADPRLAPVHQYLRQGANPLRRHQLAVRLARLFDQYMMYRPELIRDWSRGVDADDWQAILWRAVVERLAGATHKYEVLTQIIDGLTRGEVKGPALPPRIAVFGISSLPPFHLHLYQHLAAVTTVHFFLLNPCRQYWGDIYSPTSRARALRRVSADAQALDDQHVTTGNPLLASMGQQARDFIDLVLETGGGQTLEEYREPETTSALGMVQVEILDLVDPREGISGATGDEPWTADDSIQIHSCHGPMREVELLHDHLLAWFETDDGLTPRDIVVMCPNIDAYAPYVDAVFYSSPEAGQRIPYTIADRRLRLEQPIVDAFLSILELSRSNFEASKVLDILRLAPVRETFELSSEDLEIVTGWVVDLNIRWGVREDAATADADTNTWTMGMERLLAGYAMGGDDNLLWRRIAPYGNLDDGNCQLLETFLRVIDRLLGGAQRLRRQYPLADWAEVLTELIRDLLCADDGAKEERVRLVRACRNLAEIQQSTGFAEPVALDVVLDVLHNALDRARPHDQFFAGGVTFCGIVPMRNIPFRVICLVGMNEGDYPRNDANLAMDQMIKQPRKGDRSRQGDDRQIFLDALLSARDRLYISYVGRDIRDNSTLPPSPLVTELMEYLTRGMAAGNGGSRRRMLFVEHRLHGFDARYFGGDKAYFTYSRENFDAYLASQALTVMPMTTDWTQTSAPAAEKRHLSLDQLCRFFENPAAYFLRYCLRVDVATDATEIADREPYALDRLQEYQIRRAIIDDMESTGRRPELLALTRAQGALPHGVIGEHYYCRTEAVAAQFAESLPTWRGEPRRELDCRWTAGEFVLEGRLTNLLPDGLALYVPAAVKAKARLRLWIRHLLLNCCAAAADPRCSRLYYLDDEGSRILSLAPAPDAPALLKALLDVYWEGLSRPLPFFPETSWTYCETLCGTGDHGKAMERARDRWRPRYAGDGAKAFLGDSADPWIATCFRDRDPLDDQFAEYGTRVFEPMLACIGGDSG